MSGNWRYCPYSSVLTGKCLSFSSLFNYTWTTRSLKICCRTCFPVLSGMPQAGRNCRLGCQTESGGSHRPRRLLQTGPLGIRRGRGPQRSSRRGRGTSRAEEARAARRPHPSPASSGPEPYRAPAVLRWGRPPRRPAHQLARSAPRPCLGSPGSSPHKERRSDLRVNLAGPRANTIGRLFTNEPPSAWRHHPQRTQLLGIPCFLNENRKPGSFENVGSSFQCCQE